MNALDFHILFQLEVQQRQLKTHDGTTTANNSPISKQHQEDSVGGNLLMLDDDLAPYMPDVTSIENSQILESCVGEFELGGACKDPTQAESFENDDVSVTLQINVLLPF